MFGPAVSELLERPSVEVLATELSAIHRARGALDAREARVLADYERRDREAWLPAAGTASWVTNVTRTARHQAHRRVTVARAVEVIPELGEALMSATVDFEHAYRIGLLVADGDRRERVIAHVGEVLAAARAMKADQFRGWLDDWSRRLEPDGGDARDETLHRTRFHRSRRADDGMIEGSYRLDPIDGRRVEAGIERIVDEERLVERGHPDMAGADRTPDQRRADALVEIFRRAEGADAATGRRALPWVGVQLDYDTLVEHLAADGRCRLDDGTPLSPAAVRRLACEADIIPVVLGGDGMPLDVGRRHRTATWAQRVALRARYDTCAWPGCDRPFDWCEIHHLVPWELEGPTDLDNLIPLCKYHHRLVHVAHWPVTREPDGRLVTHGWATAPERARAHLPPHIRHRRRTPDVNLN